MCTSRVLSMTFASMSYRSSSTTSTFWWSSLQRSYIYIHTQNTQTMLKEGTSEKRICCGYLERGKKGEIFFFYQLVRCEFEWKLTCSCWRLRPLVFSGGALSARYLCFSSSLTRISCSSSSLAFATIRLCTNRKIRMIAPTLEYMSEHDFCCPPVAEHVYYIMTE